MVGKVKKDTWATQKIVVNLVYKVEEATNLPFYEFTKSHRK